MAVSNVYMNSRAVAALGEFFRYDQNAIKKLASNIARDLPESKKKEGIAVLDIGAGEGSLLLPLLEALTQNDVIISSVDAFDSSPHMVSLLKTQVRNHPTYRIVEHDASDMLPSEFDCKQYDLIIVTFMLQYIINWPFLINEIATKLTPGGMLIQSEFAGDIARLDGSLGGSSKSLYDELWSFYFENRNKIAPWQSDVRVSDLSKVCEYIDKHDLLLPGWIQHSDWQSTVKTELILKMIEVGAVSSLGDGLNDENKIKLKKDVIKWLTHHSDPKYFDIHWEILFLCHSCGSSHGQSLGKQEKLAKVMALYLNFRKRRESDIRSFKDAIRLPIVDHKLTWEKNNIVERLSDLMDSVIIASLGGVYESCDIIIVDISGEKDNLPWANISRVRPRCEFGRAEFFKDIAACQTNLFSHLYGDNCEKIWFSICVSKDGSVSGSLPLRAGLPSTETDALAEVIKSHKHLAISGSVDNFWIYYIPTLFKSGNPEFGVGGIVITRNRPIEEDVLLHLQTIAECELSAIGSIYLYNKQMLNAVYSARAAIMSRNLSHNVGSHSLANSRLFESIGVLHEVDSVSGDERSEFRQGKNTHPLKNGEVWRARQRLATFNSFIQGRLDFIARALGETSSWSEPMFFVNDLLRGFFSQRVLLNTLLSDNGITIKDIEFHVVLPSVSEDANNNLPMVYVGKNESNDHELRHILFGLSKQGGALKLAAAPDERDVLIAIPGGMIGRHAFYAFLENVMRNAAKYGRKNKVNGSSEPMIIQIALRDGHAVERGTDAANLSYKPCYWIDVTDNLSVDSAIRDQDKNIRAKSVSLQVRRYLNDPIITSDGRPQTAGHGIQEMKVCAEFLAGNELCFPPDDKCLDSQWKKLNHGCTYCDAIERDKAVYQGCDKENRTAWIKEENALQAFVNFSEVKTSSGEVVNFGAAKEPMLTYRLIAQKPVIMGIVNVDGVTLNNDNPAVNYHSSIEELALHTAHFGLIVVKDAEQTTIQKVLREVATLHEALPFRLMIVAPNDEIGQKWQTQIDDISAGPSKPYVRVNASDKNFDVPAGGIPVRRVYAVSCQSLYDKDSKLKPVPDFRNAGYNVFTEVYEAWLKAWKGHELVQFTADCWHLWIGFDRAAGEAQGSPIIQKWSGLKTFKSELIKVRIKTTGGDEKTNYCGNPQGLLDNKKNLIVFDNHGTVFGKKKEDGSVEEPSALFAAPACYHSFSGAGQIDLFHSLETPPNDRFGFAFLLYNVVETALLSVAVVDERVGEAMIDEQMLFGNKHRKLQMARIYPLFQVHFAKSEEMERNPYFLSPEIENAINKAVNVLDGQGDHRWCYSTDRCDIKKEEGLVIDKGTGIGGINPLVLCDGEYEHDSPSLMFLSQADKMRSSRIDAVVMHEGIVDSIRDAWAKEQPDPFFAIVPFFVRTSGRGAVSRHNGNHLPFLEFSELSDSTYQSQNKLSLGRSLLGLRGYPKRDS